MPEIIHPKDEKHWLDLRCLDVTSTESAALFGVSPYITKFELWHNKKDRHVVDINPNERMKWGTRLQNSIADGIAEDKDWQIRRMDEYMRLPDLRMGSSFDFAIENNGILEVKNVDSFAFKDGWLVNDGEVEAPPHIEIQVQHQLAVSQRKFAYIGALIGGNRVVLIKREPIPKVIESIKEKVKNFWLSIEENLCPSPDFPRDAKFISRLYSYAEKGKTINVNGSDFKALAEDYRNLSKEKKELSEKMDSVKAQILMKIGDASKVIGDKYTITASMVPPKKISYTREEYRTFRINWKKEKKDA